MFFRFWVITVLLLASTLASGETAKPVSAIQIKERSHSDFFKPVYLHISTHEYQAAQRRLNSLPKEILATTEADYIRALIAFRQGKKLAALKYLDKSSKNAKTDNFFFFVEASRIFTELGEIDKARGILTNITRFAENPSILEIATRELQYLEGVSLAKTDTDRAIVYLEDLFSNYTIDYRIPYLISDLHFKHGDFSNAEKMLFESLRISKQFRSIVLNKFVDMYIRTDNIDLALSFFKRFKNTSNTDHYRQKSANQLIRYADDLIKNDELAIAERIMVVILDENVNIGNAIRAIVFLYLQSNDYEKAERLLQRYKQEDVDKDIVLSLYYQLYASTNKYDEAIDLFESQARKDKAFLQGNTLQELLQLYRKKYRKLLSELPTSKSKATDYATFLLNNTLTTSESIALELTRELITHYPQDPDVLYVHASALAMNNFTKQALQKLATAIRIRPNNIDWLFEFVELLERDENHGAAINILFSLVRHDDSEIKRKAQDKLDFIQGKVFILQKQYDQALTLYISLLKKRPGNREILGQLAIIYLAVGEVQLASRLTQQIQIIDSTVTNKEKALENARKFARKGELKEASTILHKLEARFKKDKEILYWLGYTYAQAKQYEKAIQYVKKSSDLDPTNVRISLYIANLMVQAGKLDDARNHYLKLIESSASETEAASYIRLLNLIEGKIFLEAGDKEIALEHFTNILATYPNDVDTQKAIIDIHTKHRDWLSAVAVYKNLIKMDPKNPKLLYELAVQYEYLGDESKKEDLLIQILKEEPNSRYARRARSHFLKKGVAFHSAKKYEDAASIFNKVLHVLPGDSEFSSMLGETYIAQEKFVEGEQIFLSHLAKEPFNSTLRNRLAKLYTRQDRTEDAASEYRKIIAHEKGKALGRRAKANLTFLYGDKSNQMRDKIKSPEDIEEAISFSRMLIKDGYHDQAFQVLLKANSVSPKDAQVNYWLGTIYNAKGNYKKAKEYVEKAISYDPDNIQLVSSLARIQARSGDLDSAEKNYRKVLTHSLPQKVRDDNRKLLGYVIGQKLIAQGRLENALDHYLNLLEQFPNDAAILARIATVHIKLENYNTAEDLMQKVVTMEPVSPASHMQLAEIYRLKGKDTKYKEQLKKVLLLDPTGLGSRVLNKLGLADGNKYLKEKNWVKANEAFDQALRFSPNSHVALLGKAKALAAQKLNKEAKELLNIIVEEDPTHYKARLELAKLYVEERDYDKATIELERILFTAKFSKEGQEALFNLKKIYRKYGADLQKAGQLSSAVNFFKRIVDQDPTDLAAHLSLGRIYQRFRDKWDLAVEHYLKVIELEYHNEIAHMNLGAVYENQKKYAEAMNSFANAVAYTEVDDRKLLTTLVNGIRIQPVKMEYEKKNYEWAIEELKEISKADPSNVQYYLFLASIYSEIDELELAIAALNEGVVNDPKNNVVRFRIANLYERTSEFELALAHYRAILRTDATGPIFETALDRVPILDQLVRTFNYSMQYLVSKGYSEYPKLGQSSDYFNSTLQFNLSARVRPTKALNLSLTASPTYTSLHDSQNDSWSPSYTFNQNYNAKNGYLNTSASYNRSEDLLREEIRGSTYSLYGALGYRLKLPRFLDANDARLPKTFELSGTLLSTKTNQNIDFSFTDTYNANGKFTFVSPITTGGAWIFNYGYAINYPKEDQGRDYLYGAHQGALILNKVLARRITGTISLSGEYRQYLNVDSSHAFLQGEQVQRRYAHASVNVRLEFKAHTNLNVFGDVTAFEARSNLATGYIYSAKGIPIGIQSAAIGGSRNLSANLGMRYIF